jgi:hypothetical protein
MIDAHTTIRAFLLTNAPLVALVGTRLYAGRDVPPVGYKPLDGPCITFKVRGGGPDYEDALLNPSVQFKCYDDTETECYALYRALYAAVQNGTSATVLHAETETLGQVLSEPDTGWYFTLAYFKFMLRQA